MQEPEKLRKGVIISYTIPLKKKVLPLFLLKFHDTKLKFQAENSTCHYCLKSKLLYTAVCRVSFNIAECIFLMGKNKITQTISDKVSANNKFYSLKEVT